MTREVWRFAPGRWDGKRKLGALTRETRCYWIYRDENGNEQRVSKYDHNYFIETLAPVVSFFERNRS